MRKLSRLLLKFAHKINKSESIQQKFAQLHQRLFEDRDSWILLNKFRRNRNNKPQKSGKQKEVKNEKKADENLAPKDEKPEEQKTPDKETEKRTEKPSDDSDRVAFDFMKGFFLENSKPPTEEEEKEREKSNLHKTYAIQLAFFVIMIFVVLLHLSDLWKNDSNTKMTYSQFMRHLERKEIAEIDIVTFYDRLTYHKTVLVSLKPEENTDGVLSSILKQSKSLKATLHRTWEAPFVLDVLDVTNFLANLEQQMVLNRYEAKDFIQVKFENNVSSFAELRKVLTDTVIIVLSLYMLYALKDLKAVFDKIIPRSKKAIKTFEVKKLKGGF